LIVAASIFVGVYALPYFRESYNLSDIQFFLLTLVLVSIAAVITSGAFEYVFSLTVKDFLEKLNQAWNKHQSLSSVKSAELPQELSEILKSLNLLMEAGAKRIRELESGSGYSDSYYRLITTVSHQLRTPITGLRWALGNIQEDIAKGITPDISLVSNAREAANRVGMLVEGLLSGINETGTKTKKTVMPVDVERCLEDVVSESSLAALKRNMTFSVVKESSPIPLVSGIEYEIRFIFHSLISNAIYYGDVGSAVKVAIGLDGPYVRIIVQNSGQPITDNEKVMVFSQFNRGAEAIHLNPDGSGMGLYLTRQIVVDHGGSISFTSNHKDGTSFTVKLPLSGQGQLEKSIQHY
jgi:signal transduction histidine kinase